MQAVQNMAAKITLGRGKYDSATSCLVQLHWLPIKFRIDYKIISIVPQMSTWRGTALSDQNDSVHKSN